MGIVVSDTSPIRALASLSLLELLPRMFDQVYVSPAVVRELQDASIVLPETFRVQAPKDASLLARLKVNLHDGEAEALTLAVELNSQAVLMDEAHGRAVAAALGLEPRGVLGVLVDAKKRGFVPEIRPLIMRLKTELKFRMADRLIHDILEASGETSPG